MILVADSGSSKCDWIVTDGKNQTLLSTMGFNPFFHNTDIIAAKMIEAGLGDYAGETKKVFYYGAGCSSPEFNLVVRKAISSVFPHSEVYVDHDLAGAAHATCDHKPGIACILGTGSNSCYFDGENIIEKIPALGYILGDEGSGAYFGKKLLAAYLYNRLPPKIYKNFQDHYNISKKEIFENVYMKPNANVYLASFMRFLSGLRDDVQVREMIYQGFSDFIRIHVWCYENNREVPVHFVGSIAHYFEDLLRHACRVHHLTLGNILKQPVYALVNYHLQNEGIIAADAR